MSQATRVIVGLLIILLTGLVLLPTGIAVIRNHPRVVTVTVWNTVGLLLFGLGWIVALVLAVTDPDKSGGIRAHLDRQAAGSK